MEQQPKFKLEDVVYFASWTSEEDKIVCPDCNGEGRIRVLLYDDTVLSIECDSCKRGYSGSFGYIKTYKRTGKVEYGTIKGISINEKGYEYSINVWSTWTNNDGTTHSGNSSYPKNEDKLFFNKEDAQKEAVILTEQENKKEIDRINHKEKPTKTWAWHVSYYRKQIRDAQRTIEHATKALNVAKIKAKEPE